jgi:predicted kinase
LFAALHAKGFFVNPTMIVIGGVPGTGKSTLANALSKDMNIPVFSKDELEAAVVRKGLGSSKNMHGVGYEILASLATKQIENGNNCIFDFIASRNRVEELWPQLLEYDIKYIECVCTMEDVHKDRIQSRNRNIKGWYELTWEEVLNIKSNYQSLKPERLVLDSICNVDSNIKLAKEYVSQ